MRKKKTIAIVLAAFIVLPLVVSGSVQLLQLYLKHRAIERLETENLVTMSFLLQDVQWVEEDREIMVDGKMFDLKSYHKKGSYLVATGIWDEQETRAVKILGEFNGHDHTQFVVNLLLLAQTLGLGLLWNVLSPFIALSKKRFPSFNSRSLLCFPRVIFQPPRPFLFFFSLI